LDVVLPALAADGLGKSHALLAAHLPVVSRDCSLGIVSLWQARRDLRFKRFKLSSKMLRNLGIALAVLTVLGTGAYAYAFTRIYTRPHTRVAATTWIYDNIPGQLIW
jgi:hypothetical protein